MTHPYDRVLRLTLQARSDMTTVGNVTLKVRKNGGAATTYTNVSTPAIAALSDDTASFAIELAASTYAAGDRLEWVWLYSGTRVAVGGCVIGYAETDGSKVDATISSRSTLTAAGVWDALLSGITTASSIGKLVKDNLDAAISSRSTYAGADTSGTTTLLSRLTSGRASGLDYLDASVASRSTYAGGDTAGVTTLLTRLSAGRATALDYLDAAVSSRSTYAGADSSGVTTLLARLTSGRAGALDYLDAAVSSRSSHTAADVWTSGTRTLTSFGTLVADIWAAATSGLTTVGSIGKLIGDYLDAAVSSRSTYAGADSSGVTTLLARLTALRAAAIDNLDATVSSRLASASYTAAPSAASIADAVWDETLAGHTTTGTTGAAIAAIKGKTDLLGTGELTAVASPVATDGTVRLIAGDDYSASDGRALTFTDTGTTWGSVSGATAELVIGGLAGDDDLTLDATLAAGPPATAVVELTSAETLTLGPGRHEARLTIIRSGRRSTVAQVAVTVSSRAESS